MKVSFLMDLRQQITFPVPQTVMEDVVHQEISAPVMDTVSRIQKAIIIAVLVQMKIGEIHHVQITALQTPIVRPHSNPPCLTLRSNKGNSGK